MELPYKMVTDYKSAALADVMRKPFPDGDIYVVLVRLNDRRGPTSDFYRWFAVRVSENDGNQGALITAPILATATRSAAEGFACKSSLDAATVAAMWHAQHDFSDHTISVRGELYAQQIIDHSATQGAWSPTIPEVRAGGRAA